MEVRNHVFVLAAIMVGEIRALQKEWPEIVEDIRTGKLNKKLLNQNCDMRWRKSSRPVQTRPAK